MEKNNAADEPAEPSFDAILKFEPTVRSSTRLYHNGNQQVAIEVYFVATKNGEPAVLTPAEEESIRLVMYNTGGDIPSTWHVDDAWKEYDYYPEPGLTVIKPAAIRRSGERNQYTIEMFVSTTETGGLSRKFTLALTRDVGNPKVIVTNGKTPLFPILNYEITLQPVKPPTYALGNYEWEKNIMVREDGGNGIFVANYYLGLVGNDNQPIKLKTMKVLEDGMIQWHDKVEGETHASYTGYGQPGDNVAHYNPDIPLGPHTPEGTVRSPIDGKGTVILVGAVNVPFDRESAVNRGGPCGIEAVDDYGNTHALNVRFKQKDDPSGRFDLEIFK